MQKDLQMTKVREAKARRKRVQIIACGLKLLWTLLGLVGLISVVQWTCGKVAGAENHAYGREVVGTEPTVIINDTDTQEKEVKQDGPEEQVRQKCEEIYERNQDLLVLVNKDNELCSEYDPQLRTICNGRLEASERLYEDLCAMLQAAGEAGYDYWIASAYRSRSRQQELIDEDVSALTQQGLSYQEALARTLRETMPAGHSEHETGLALDILCSGNTNMDVSQANEPGNEWLVTHCWEYGFILRYPEDKEDVTQIAYEPWHFRYVGREAAQFLTEEGITLEEFFEMLG